LPGGGEGKKNSNETSLSQAKGASAQSRQFIGLLSSKIIESALTVLIVLATGQQSWTIIGHRIKQKSARVREKHLHKEQGEK